MNYGIQNNPDNWRLYYDLGFVYYTELKDYKNAADTFARGSRVPNAHPFLKVIAAQMASHAGDYETARRLWLAKLPEHPGQTDQAERSLTICAHCVSTKTSSICKQAVTRFGERTGRLPPSMAELVQRQKDFPELLSILMAIPTK